MQFRLQRHGVGRGNRSSDNCGDTDEDTDKDDECRDTKPSKNTPPSFRFLRLGNHTTRRTPNSNWTAICNLFLPSIEGSLPENIAGRQSQFRGKPVPKNFCKNYMSDKILSWDCVQASNETQISHGRVSWQTLEDAPQRGRWLHRMLGAFFHIAQSVLNLPVAPAVLLVE